MALEFPKEFYDIVEGIKVMKIRGAGRIARSAVKALRIVSSSIQTSSPDKYLDLLKKAAKMLVDTRPTAVSLPNGLRYVLNRILRDFDEGIHSVDILRDRFERYSNDFISLSLNAVKKIGKYGAGRIENGDVVLTHCNSAAALEVIKTAHSMGKDIRVFVTETRPRFQGRLSAEVLDREGIEVILIVDSASRYFMNKVDKVVVGADAIAANGAVVNKIGTSLIALAAHEARVPFMVAAESYKFSPDTVFGKLVTIEEREVGEVVPRNWLERRSYVKVRNPAFDATPPDYIDLIITEYGIFSPSVFPLLIKEHFGSFYWELEPWEVSS